MSDVVHAVMYRDHQIGTLCQSLAWGPDCPSSADSGAVTCPLCRQKLDGGPVVHRPQQLRLNMTASTESILAYLAELFPRLLGLPICDQDPDVCGDQA